jgi:hypothetical protein
VYRVLKHLEPAMRAIIQTAPLAQLLHPAVAPNFSPPVPPATNEQEPPEPKRTQFQAKPAPESTRKQPPRNTAAVPQITAAAAAAAAANLELKKHMLSQPLPQPSEFSLQLSDAISDLGGRQFKSPQQLSKPPCFPSCIGYVRTQRSVSRVLGMRPNAGR